MCTENTQGPVDVDIINEKYDFFLLYFECGKNRITYLIVYTMPSNLCNNV